MTLQRLKDRQHIAELIKLLVLLGLAKNDYVIVNRELFRKEWKDEDWVRASP